MARLQLLALLLCVALLFFASSVQAGPKAKADIQRQGTSTPKESGRFVIILQSSSDPGVQLQASVPSDLPEAVVFTSRRLSEGVTLYDTNLGYFSTLAEAEKAQQRLLKRFPHASVVPLRDKATQ